MSETTVSTGYRESILTDWQQSLDRLHALRSKKDSIANQIRDELEAQKQLRRLVRVVAPELLSEANGE
jgi:hypothetical protein